MPEQKLGERGPEVSAWGFKDFVLQDHRRRSFARGLLNLLVLAEFVDRVTALTEQLRRAPPN